MLEKFSKNLNSSIGLPYELIVIDNTEGKYNIFEAYNLGAKKAKFDYVCFIHEDIQFLKQSWGKHIRDLLSDPEIGLVGVAGSRYKAAVTSAWWDVQSENREYITQHNEGSATLRNINPKQKITEQVVSLDGVFLATKKQVLKEFPFDEQTFNGFHFYDADFSASVLQKYKLVVTYGLLIEHLSMGNHVSDTWLQGAMAFQKKWHHKLPLQLENFSLSTKLKYEKEASYNLLKTLNQLPVSKLKVFIFNMINTPFPINIFVSFYFIYMSLKKKLGLIRYKQDVENHQAVKLPVL